MYDIFSYSRGKLLINDTDLYGKIFSEARSKTAEHNIYERSDDYLGLKNEKSQNSKKTAEN